MRSSPRPPSATGSDEVGGDPGEEAPVAEHREGVHGGGQQAVAPQVRRATSTAQRARARRRGRAAPARSRTRARRGGSRTRPARAARPRRRRRASRSSGARAATTPAARISPMAQADCIRPSALPRCSGRPGLGDERRARRPLAAHAQPEDEAEDGELDDRGAEAAGAAGQRVHEDRDHQRARAAHAVGQEAEQRAADGGGHQGEGVEQARRGLVHPQVAHQVGEDQGVEHHVHGVEHPAEAARHERAPLRRRDVGGPDRFHEVAEHNGSVLDSRSTLR